MKKRNKRKNLTIRKRFARENDVTLFHGDCLNLMKQIPDNSAQLVITSPPYNLGKSYEKKQTLESYLQQQRRVIEQAIRITRKGGSICWQVGHHLNGYKQVIPLDLQLHPLFQEYAISHGLRLRNRLIWHFEHGLHCKYRFSGRHETILWYSKGESCTFNLDDVRVPQKYPGKRSHKGPNRGQLSGHPLGKNPGDVWIFPNVKNNHVEKTDHPCQFPVELPERLILALTSKGDLVVDPFIGVGTTAVACVLHERRAAGADLISAYLDIARERVKKASSGKLRCRPINRPVYVVRPNTTLTTVPKEFAESRAARAARL